MMELEHEAYAFTAEGRKLRRLERQHVGAIYDEGTAVWSGKGAEYFQKSGFAGAGSTGDGHHLTFFNLEIDPLQNFQGAERLAYVTRLDYHTMQR